MLNLGLKISSWRYKQSIRRCVVMRDGRAVSNRAAQGSNTRVPPNASFVDGVATKDCIIDPATGVAIRIFLPHHCLGVSDAAGSKGFGWLPRDHTAPGDEESLRSSLELSDGSSVGSSNGNSDNEKLLALEEALKFSGGYFPASKQEHVKLPVIVQFHGGAFVSGSKDSSSNDVFCRRIAKACKCIVIAVGYRLAPDNKFPAPRDDGIFTLKWLAKQGNLAAFPATAVSHGIIESFGQMPADPWISAHVDYSRCALMGIGAGGTIAEQVSQACVSLKLELEPLKVVSQVLIYPLLGGSTPLPSEISLADAYFLDREMLALAWSWFLPEEHLAVASSIDPRSSSRSSILSKMPSTLVISAELDMLRDRAAAYVQALKMVSVDASFLTYRNAVHGFATIDCFLDTKLAQACVEDIAIWFAKHVKCDYWG
ncbi:probable carboxylesterase 16 [Selaginella moellendorffii]|nr:probable carboxylesterase 16 [Selaginella moellendorffii]|eukprot:XP_002986388.2 probable carboxylesterase 16 [Selaginella moellendorffii]